MKHIKQFPCLMFMVFFCLYIFMSCNTSPISNSSFEQTTVLSTTPETAWVTSSSLNSVYQPSSDSNYVMIPPQPNVFTTDTVYFSIDLIGTIKGECFSHNELSEIFILIDGVQEEYIGTVGFEVCAVSSTPDTDEYALSSLECRIGDLGPLAPGYYRIKHNGSYVDIVLIAPTDN